MLVAIHQKTRSRCLVHEFSFTDIFSDINHGYRAAILKKNSLSASVLYGCGYILLLSKCVQNDAHCNCIVPP